MLNKEARKWSAKVVRDMRTIRDKTKEVNQLLDQIHAAKVFFDITFVNQLCAVVELIEIVWHYNDIDVPAVTSGHDS